MDACTEKAKDGCVVHVKIKKNIISSVAMCRRSVFDALIFQNAGNK